MEPRTIPLTQGKIAIVDADDYESLIQHEWCYSQVAKEKGYAMRRVDKHAVYMHVVIIKPPPGLEVDHKNGDKLDNRKENLRICTHAQNNRNKKKRAGCSSRYKGVSWSKQRRRWQAHIRVNNKSTHLGRFENEDEAARAYDTAAREHFGEFAKLNFPE